MLIGFWCRFLNPQKTKSIQTNMIFNQCISLLVPRSYKIPWVTKIPLVPIRWLAGTTSTRLISVRTTSQGYVFCSRLTHSAAYEKTCVFNTPQKNLFLGLAERLAASWVTRDPETNRFWGKWPSGRWFMLVGFRECKHITRKNATLINHFGGIQISIHDFGGGWSIPLWIGNPSNGFF